jgi:hypothetical protein
MQYTAQHMTACFNATSTQHEILLHTWPSNKWHDTSGSRVQTAIAKSQMPATRDPPARRPAVRPGLPAAGPACPPAAAPCAHAAPSNCWLSGTCSSSTTSCRRHSPPEWLRCQPHATADVDCPASAWSAQAARGPPRTELLCVNTLNLPIKLLCVNTPNLRDQLLCVNTPNLPTKLLRVNTPSPIGATSRPSQQAWYAVHTCRPSCASPGSA